MLFAIYQWASLVPSFVVNAIERGPLVRLCPADPPNILEYDKYYEKSQNHQGQQLALSRQQRPRIPSGMVKKGRTRIPNGPNGFSNQRITIRSARPGAPHRSIQLRMSWKRRQELLIEFERHEHANLHDANAD